MNPFSSERKKMSTLVQNKTDKAYDIDAKYLFIKGAPNIILKDCHVQYKGSHVSELSEFEKESYLKTNDNFASDGFRVLAVAYKKIENDVYAEEDMVFLGFAVTYDPPRAEVAAAVTKLHNAGLKITIITGDYGLTAAAIGRQTGIIEKDFLNYDGVDVERMSNEELQEVLKQSTPIVFSRTTPQHKLKIVEAYKANGEIVAVTGDGVNDILALKSAHMGIAMGKNGTDVARSAADMILLDDNFATISSAVLEGRGIYENIKKFVSYVLCSNIPELIPVLMMIFFQIPPALTVLQVLAIDLLTDIVPALALGAEKPNSNLMSEPPRAKTDNVLNKKLLFRAYIFLGLIEAALSFGMFLVVLAINGFSFTDIRTNYQDIVNEVASPALMNAYRMACTMTLGAVVFCQIGNVFACRSDKLSFFKTIKKKNMLIYIGIISEVTIFILIANVPFLQNIFQTASVPFYYYLILLILPVVFILLDWVYKLIASGIRSRRDRRLAKSN
jgi:magnesium-transporting ATPase (P-type)